MITPAQAAPQLFPDVRLIALRIQFLGCVVHKKVNFLVDSQERRESNVQLHPYRRLLEALTMVLSYFCKLKASYQKNLDVFLNQLSRIIIDGGIILSLFVALLLNNKIIRKSRANLFLSILLLALSFSITHILFAGAILDHLSTQVYSIGDPTFYLIAPLLWFYVRELTGERIKWTLRLVTHFLPLFLIILFSLSFRSVNSESFLLFLNYHHKAINILFWITLVAQFSWYQVLIHRKRISYEQLIQREVSNTENVSISWVKFFMIVFLVINLLFLFSLFAAIHLKTGTWLPKTTALIFSLSIFALGYKGILQKEIFQQGEQKISGESENRLALPVKEKLNQSRVNQLLAYMEDKKPYFDAELTLTSLAKGLNITRSQLSELINEGTGDNFYDFVNKYRVEQVKKSMIDPGMKHFSMLGLALEAGFKSKSTFNLIFKRFTGLTPSEYRKSILAK